MAFDESLYIRLPSDDDPFGHKAPLDYTRITVQLIRGILIKDQPPLVLLTAS